MNSRASNRRLLISTLVASALLAAAPLARAVSTPAALTFSADRETVTSGQTVRLRWSATNVQQCRASGAWRGSPPVVGVQRSTPVVNTATFTLSCSGSGGMVSRSVTVRVAPGSSASSTAQSGSASASSPSQTSESSSDSLLDPALSASIKPTLNLSVDRATVAAGQQVLLRWSATQVQSCQASGGWNGYPRNLGVSRSGPLTAPTTFTLTCDTVVGTLTRSVTVNVQQPTNVATAPTGSSAEGQTPASTPASTPATGPATVAAAPAPVVEPRLELRVSSTKVRPGDQVSLSWTSAAVSNCRASGNWSGTRAASGSEQLAAVTTAQSFTLRCDSTRGEIVAMTSVEVVGSASIAWQQPTYNLDGTVIDGLRALRIHVGTTSGQYTQIIEVSDLSRSQTDLELPVGEYFIAMSAVDTDGTESALSNEVRRVVQ